MRIRFIPLIFIYYLRACLCVCVRLYSFLSRFFFFPRKPRLFVLLYYNNICFHLPSPAVRRNGHGTGTAGGGGGALNEKNFFACFCQASRGIAFRNLWLNVLPSKKKKKKTQSLNSIFCRGPAISYLYYQSDSLDLRRRRHYYHVVACISRLPKCNYKEPGVVKVERIAEKIFEFATHNNTRRPPTGRLGL